MNDNYVTDHYGFGSRLFFLVIMSLSEVEKILIPPLCPKTVDSRVQIPQSFVQKNGEVLMVNSSTVLE